MPQNIHIRAAQECDNVGITAVNEAAFPTRAEAHLVSLLQQQVHPLISLVAEDEDAIVGHILFSPVTLGGHPELMIMGLAPMAVLPAYQRHGIGSALVRAGLDACRKLGAGAVVVLGHPHYYPRFGFVPAVQFGIDSEYEVPPELFMAIELLPGYLQGACGTIKYHAAFNSV